MSHVFFFKQKTAYEMRISDWSSDVCSSDLLRRIQPDHRIELRGGGQPRLAARHRAPGWHACPTASLDLSPRMTSRCPRVSDLEGAPPAPASTRSKISSPPASTLASPSMLLPPSIPIPSPLRPTVPVSLVTIL